MWQVYDEKEGGRGQSGHQKNMASNDDAEYAVLIQCGA